MRLWAILAVLAVGASIPLLRTDPETRLVPAPDMPAVRMRPVVYDLDFADDRHGFALSGRCAEACQNKLLTTEDGVTWVARPFSVPRLAAPKQLAARIVALGAGRVMLTDLENRFYSNDSGLTWSEVPLAPNQTVGEIPADGVLETECVDEAPLPNSRPACLRRRVVVTLPDTGERALLAKPPSIENPTPEARPADDGSWWVSGREASTGRWVVASSRDAGRTWSNTELPVPSGLAMNMLSGAGSGLNRFLLATGWLPDAMEPRNLVAIFRSTDGGVHWAQTWRGTGNAPRTVGGTAIVTADGGLLLPPDDVGPIYRSLDGGASFAPMLDGPRLNSVRRTGVGYLALASDQPTNRYLRSLDGVHWTSVTVP
jgi:hypothetical protein